MDLKNGLVRTPLDPIQTFLDDPLRILRAFWFATRLEFKIEDNTYDSIQNHNPIKEAFKNKISKERIGKEMLSTYSTSLRPFKFMEFLQKTGFLPLVLNLSDLEKLNKGYSLAQLFEDSKNLF